MKIKKNDYSALDLENLDKEIYSKQPFEDNCEIGKNNIEENKDNTEEEEKKLDIDMNEFKNLEAEDKIEINSKLHFIVKFLSISRIYKEKVEVYPILKLVPRFIYHK